MSPTSLRFTFPGEHHISPEASPFATRSPTPFPSPIFSTKSTPPSSSSSLASTLSTPSLASAAANTERERNGTFAPPHFHFYHGHGHQYRHPLPPNHQEQQLHLHQHLQPQLQSQQQTTATSTTFSDGVGGRHLSRKISLRSSIAHQNRRQELAAREWNKRSWVVRAWKSARGRRPEILGWKIVQPVREGERFALDD